MEYLEALRAHAVHLPIMAKFAVAMAVLGVPLLFRAMALPGVVGLLLAGIVLGPHTLDVFPLHPVVAEFFSDLGKLLLMFFAGLEIDLEVLKRARNRSIAFGFATTLLPLAAGRRHGGRPDVRLRGDTCRRHRLAARVAYVARDPDPSRDGRGGTRIDHRHRWRHP